MEKHKHILDEFASNLRQLAETQQKDMMLKARENPAIAATKAARGKSAEEVHRTIMKALEDGKVVTVPTRQVPDFEAPAIDHHLVMHQGKMMLVSPKGRGREIHMLSPSDTGHIRVQFREKGRRAAKPVYLHAGFQGSGDVIESDPAYRVSLVGGVAHFRGLPDMSEDVDHMRIMNLLEQRLKKKDWARGILGGLAVAGSVIGAHQATRATLPTLQTSAPAVAKIGSGKVEAKVKTEQQTSKAHELAGKLIRKFEGFRSKAYNKDGHWTIGWGNTSYSNGQKVKPGDTITREQADAEHEHHISSVVVPKLEKTIPHWHSMNDHQRASLISFSYNAGQNFYGHSKYGTITHALSHPDNWHLVPDAMALYNKGFNNETGKVETLTGLIRRRGDEAGHWKTGLETIQQKPVN